MRFWLLEILKSRYRVERLKNGIEIPDTINNQLQECAEKLSVSIGEKIIEAKDKTRY